MGSQERIKRVKEQRRADILDAAEKVFFSRGFDAKLSDIAEQAELAKGTIYLYFNSKEDLYFSVLLRGLDILAEMFEKAFDTTLSPVEQLRTYSTEYASYFREHRPFFRMLYRYEHPRIRTQVSPAILHQLSRRSKGLLTFVANAIKRGIHEGLFRSDLDPLQATVVLWTSLSGILREIDLNENDPLWSPSDLQAPLSSVNLEELYNLSFDLLLRGLSA